jgi:hypothetical protein
LNRFSHIFDDFPEKDHKRKAKIPTTPMAVKLDGCSGIAKLVATAEGLEAGLEFAASTFEFGAKLGTAFGTEKGKPGTRDGEPREPGGPPGITEGAAGIPVGDPGSGAIGGAEARGFPDMSPISMKLAQVMRVVLAKCITKDRLPKKEPKSPFRDTYGSM